ncbi:MAG: response regulator [Candidatus Latescibacteria bacterium]|nr:response regulator [Candidatus Latescibacterota bacterium]
MSELGRILIADDEETFLYSTADLLRKQGYQCDCALDAAAAAELLRANDYDLLIADIKMPDNEELEFIQGIPLIAEDMPIILVTAYPSLYSAIQSVQLPVVAYMIKPIEFDELLVRVQRSIKIFRGFVEHKRAEEALREAHEELERRVGERTAELLKLNEQLKREIEERKQVEKQLRQAQKMEAIGTLAGGIAHDFNNILAVILGFTEIALNMPEDTRTQHWLKQVLKAGERAKELVQQILAFSRETEQERKPVRITPILKETLKLLSASLPATIEIREDVAASGTILGDPTQIHQVLMNLCTNAAYAMREEGGVLTVSQSDVELDVEAAARYPNLPPGSYLRLIVSDTGHGMDRAVMERIFDPYFTTKEPNEGTGLGLSVVHGIVQSYGGVITVDSEPGKGTSFHVVLPRIDREDTPKAETFAPLPTGNERILFIDDEEMLVEMGQEMLESLGYDVVALTNNLEALETFRAQPDRFDLVITDQTMPHKTGAELARELLRIRPDIPIILCTGFSEIITEKQAEATGIRRFLMKPILRREMAQTIRDLLDE